MRRPRHKLQVSTFPFLAVLLCAMGALILFLLVMDRRAKIVALHNAEETRANRRAALEVEDAARKAEWEKQREALHQVLLAEQQELDGEAQQLAGKLAAARQALAARQSERDSVTKAAENETERLTQGLAQYRATVSQLKDNDKQSKAAKAQLQRLSREVADLEMVLREMKALKAREHHTYSLVPYHGKRGDTRKPIYVECAGDGLIFHPDRRGLEGVDFNAIALRGEVERRAGKLEREVKTKNNEPEPGRPRGPYVLFLVRPDGIAGYYHAMSLLRGFQVDFGYEMIDQHWVLDFSGDLPAGTPPWDKTARTPVRTVKQQPFTPPAVAAVPGSVPGFDGGAPPTGFGFPAASGTRGPGFGMVAGSPSVVGIAGSRGAPGVGAPGGSYQAGNAAPASPSGPGIPGGITPGAPTAIGAGFTGQIGGGAGTGVPGPGSSGVALPGDRASAGAGSGPSAGQPSRTPGSTRSIGAASADPANGAGGTGGPGGLGGSGFRPPATRYGMQGGAPGAQNGNQSASVWGPAFSVFPSFGATSGYGPGGVSAGGVGAGGAGVPGTAGRSGQSVGPPGSGAAGTRTLSQTSAPAGSAPPGSASSTVPGDYGNPAPRPLASALGIPDTGVYGGGAYGGAESGSGAHGAYGGGSGGGAYGGGPSGGGSSSGGGPSSGGSGGSPQGGGPSAPSASQGGAASATPGQAASGTPGGGGGLPTSWTIPGTNVTISAGSKGSGGASGSGVPANRGSAPAQADDPAPPNNRTMGFGGGSADGDGGSSGSGGVSGLPGPTLPPVPGAAKATPRPATRPLAHTLGNRDFIVTIACYADHVTVNPGGRRYWWKDGSAGLIEELTVKDVQGLIAARQRSVRPGEPPYRPVIRFQLAPDGLGSYLHVYPRLEFLHVPMSRENLNE